MEIKPQTDNTTSVNSPEEKVDVQSPKDGKTVAEIFKHMSRRPLNRTQARMLGYMMFLGERAKTLSAADIFQLTSDIGTKILNDFTTTTDANSTDPQIGNTTQHTFDLHAVNEMQEIKSAFQAGRNGEPPQKAKKAA